MAKIQPRNFDELSEREQKAFVEDLKKHSYTKKVWETVAVMTVQQYSKYVKSFYGELEISQVEVYAQPYTFKKDGKEKKSSFLKVKITFEDGTEDTQDLSKNKTDYEEGDLLDPQTLLFCWEKFQDETHPYVKADILE